ncbi:site-specific integrase [Thermoanaerobacter sp. CM-CNRG TB177]|jgi:integrase|uniref:Tyrosine recombinase XerC-like n=2 Tax=Caldanaerobacter subterraneus TaxID=911092 RepID=XERCL_CALS4|nr:MULTISPECIES: site-specific integrase [Thermoanaerobacteraceae]Q8R890.1 RecName: Full=Tyrosine recombinase XerC-like [Caldanaerobacter subterraneus subsp. tengcongensis MB4]AAM25292.1 Integrase [Caldanaerobacter subterraneus subsp. tengcongensis MB4]MBT1278917.1 site-specific integrase [Thermoanaerobacter sp. CM-CNRG TB177]MCS3915108.1 integrase [Caldanaerobacter subterraneus subsp. tengcongensis MB4]TCO67476.1 site-specific recombinase XerD [Caldanaerobacter subterraneus]
MAKKTNYVKNGKEYYRVTVTIGRDENGKLIRKEFYGKTKKEAEAKKEEYLNGIRNGLNVDFQDVTLGDLMHTWLFEVVRMSRKPATFVKYEGHYRNYIKNSELYGMKISIIKSIQIQRYYNKLYQQGKSSKTIKALNNFLKTFFNYAVDEGYLAKNPCTGKKIVIPGTPEEKIETEIETFSDEEIKKIKEALKGHRLKALFLLAFGTGLRQGELLGLKWTDIDFEKKELRVQRMIKQVTIIDEKGNRKYKTIEQIPKTKNSIRTVPIPSSLIPMLKEHRNRQREEKLKAGSVYLNDVEKGYVFTTELGNTIDASNLLKTYKKILNRAGVPYRKFHAIRHTYATKLFERGVPLKTVSELLGHSNISITANIYTHVIPKQKTNAVETLNDLFI